MLYPVKKYVFTGQGHLFTIPAATPVAVSSLIESAFVLSWGDYESCLNRVRTCLELILDGLHIKRFTVKNGRRERLSLYARIKLAQVKAPSTEPFLMAVRHLGNAGSHSGGLTREDAFDALDLLEAIVITRYGNQKIVNRLAQKIEKNKGPLKRKTK
ncbi:MAG: DUF4145 domain-containing protein [Gallionellaceae bacterium]|nr:MAG: DUF4145 domain-containing protein [Gallionellaceae bacterium]